MCCILLPKEGKFSMGGKNAEIRKRSTICPLKTYIILNFPLGFLATSNFKFHQ